MKKVCNLIFIVSILMALLLLVSNFSFSTVANASNYKGEYISISYELNEDKEVIWSLDFGLNTDKMGLKEEEKATYRVNMQLMVGKLAEKKKKSIVDFYLNNPVEEYKPDNVIKASTPIYDQKTDSAGFKIKYSSIDVYNFYNFKENDVNEVQENVFITTQIKKTTLPFAEVIEVENQQLYLGQYYYNEFVSACKGLSIESQMALYDPQFIYDYQSSSHRIKTNSDLTYNDADGNCHYVWTEKINTLNQLSIVSLSLTTANKGWWYLLAIIVPLLVMAIIIAVIKIKDKVSKKQEKLPN